MSSIDDTARDHRAIWKSMPRELRWAYVACGLVRIDEETGSPVLEDPEKAVRLAMMADAEAGAP